MTQDHRLDDRDIERLLSGRSPGDPSYGRLGEALSELRAVYMKAPSEDTARAHVAAIVDEAHLVAAPGELTEPRARPPAAGARPSFRRKVMGNRLGRLVIRLSAATLGLSLVSGGLVLAGVNVPGLPDRASDRAEEATTKAAKKGAAGTEVGAQGEVGATQAPAFLAVLLDYISTTTDEGCFFGQTVAGIASGDKASGNDPCEQGAGVGAQGSRATGEEKSAQGRERNQSGQSTASEKKQSGQSTASEKKSSGAQTSEDAKTSGREKGRQRATDARTQSVEEE